MKTTYYLVFCIVAFAAVFSTASSCKKKKKYCTGGGTCRSVLEAKEFFLFKEGSWWVYEEETTHERDSQYVYEYHNSGSWNFSMRIHSTLEGFNYQFWPIYADGAIEECSESEPVSGRCIHIYRYKGKPGNYVGQSICFFLNYNLSDWTYGDNYSNPYEKITFTGINQNIQMPVGNFNNTICLNEEKTLIENNQSTNHFYVKNVGLIRKELLDSNQVWNLVNYHIEQ